MDMQTQQLPCCCRSRQEDCFDRLVEVRDADCGLRLLGLVMWLVRTATAGTALQALFVGESTEYNIVYGKYRKFLKNGVELFSSIKKDHY